MLSVTALLLASSVAAHNVLELHGSGTTNPSRWFWEILDIIEARAKEPLHMTYRAVGSSTGMQEFVGPESGFVAQSDFGAGDIPMSASRFQELVDAGRSMVHVPIAIGGIALFHSIPEAELGGEPLSLDACLIARIFSGDILNWGDPDVKAKNPALTSTADINVAHRVEGSSSTYGFTAYLSQTCPVSWTLGSSSTFCPPEEDCDNDWPVGVGQVGSSGMSDYLEGTTHAIAYIDSGHGIQNDLAEIALENKEGIFLKSSEAEIGNAAAKAIEEGVFPTDPSASFADVQLFDKSGTETWPITMVTYIYLDKDMSAKDNETAALTKFFVEFVISEEGQLLAEENLFVRMPLELITLAKAALQQITYPAGMVPFVRETDIDAEAGARDYVISDVRESFADRERKELLEAVDQLEAEQDALFQTVTALGAAAPSGPQLAPAGPQPTSTGPPAIIQLHGSGTTNPSRWYWETFDLLEARAKEPLHMTYRAVGSSTGMAEFVGMSQNNTALSDFASGDIPMSAELFSALTAAGRSMVHVPVAIGGIALFHSIPEENLNGEPLKLTACLIARIYMGNITRWDDPDIMNENPKLNAPSPIYVAHRVEGSSSTSGFTTYLTRKCSKHWKLGGASTFCKDDCDNDWPTGVGMQGSGGMTEYLESRTFGVAYIDSGHGIDNDLSEIALENADGVFLKSFDADIGAAAAKGIETSVFPADPAADFSSVELFNLPGPKTWPITMVTYIYLEKDWTTKDIYTAALLEAFVQFIVSEEGQAIAAENLFVKMPTELIALANKALASIMYPTGMIHFTRETDTLAEAGQQAFVLSDKRESFGDYERKELIETADSLKADLANMLKAIGDLQAQGTEYQRAVDYVDQQSNKNAMSIAGLVLGLLGCILGAIALFIAIYKNKTTAKPTFNARPGVEMKPANV